MPAVMVHVRDQVVLPFYQQKSGSMLETFSDGMEMVLARITNASFDGEFDPARLKGLARDMMGVIRDATSPFPAMKCVVDLVSSDMDVVLDDNFLLSVMQTTKTNIYNQFERIAGVSVADLKLHVTGSTVAAKSNSVSSSDDPLAGKAIDRMMQKILEKIPEDTRLGRTLDMVNTVVAQGVGTVCNKTESVLLSISDQITQTSLGSALAKPKYDDVLCPLVRGEGGVKMSEVADAAATRAWGVVVDWSMQRFATVVIDPLMQTLTSSLTTALANLLALFEGIFGFIPEVGAVIFHIVTALVNPVAAMIVNSLSYLMNVGLSGALRLTLTKLGDRIIESVTSQLTRLDDTADGISQAITDVGALVDSVQDSNWYMDLVKPMLSVVIKPFVSRVMKNLVPDAHREVTLCRAKIQQVKRLVENWVCTGDYAPDRTFPGTRITYTNSGGGFAAMCEMHFGHTRTLLPACFVPLHRAPSSDESLVLDVSMRAANLLHSQDWWHGPSTCDAQFGRP